MVPRFRSRNFGGMLPVGDAYAKHPVGVGGAYTPTRRHETDAEKFRRRRGRIYAPYRRSPKPLYRSVCLCVSACPVSVPAPPGVYLPVSFYRVLYRMVHDLHAAPRTPSECQQVLRCRRRHRPSISYSSRSHPLLRPGADPPSARRTHCPKALPEASACPTCSLVPST